MSSLLAGKLYKKDNSSDIASVVSKLPKSFPPSFHYLVSNYCFPAFETDGLMLFANTGTDNYWELSSRLFGDMSPVLLANGFLQIGNPFFYNYDPVCFDTRKGGGEYALVQLDHEAALLSSEIKVVEEIAPSFVDFLSKVVANADA